MSLRALMIVLVTLASSVFFARVSEGGAPPPTFRDETFLLDDWTITKISDNTPTMTGTISVGQPLTGGNPDAFRSVQHSWCGNGSGGSQGIAFFHEHHSFVWDLAVDGPLDSLSYNYQVIFSPVVNPNAVGMSFGVRQGTAVFGISHVATVAAWTQISATGVHGANFSQFNTGPQAQLDLSPSAPPLHFGIITHNGTGNNECLVTNSGFDNLRITITSTSPRPILDAGVDVDASDLDAAPGDVGTSSDASAGDAVVLDDAAVAPDAAELDASSVVDAGVRADASARMDARVAVDSGVSAADAGTSGDDSGCDCSTSRSDRRTSGAWMLGLFAALAWWARRR